MPRHAQIKSLLMASAVLLSLLALTPDSSATSQGSLPLLQVSGHAIVREDGTPAILRGANLPTLRLGDPWMGKYAYSRLLDAAKSFGFNVVRLPVLWSELEPSFGEYNVRYVDLVREIVNLAERRGIYVVVDMHQYKMAKKFGGIGFPSWATANFSSEGAAALAFWNTPALQAELTKAWVLLASSLKEKNAVFGYDLLNEPHPGPISWDRFGPLLNQFYESLISRIRSVDARHMVIFEPVLGVAVLGDHIAIKPRAANLVFSPHLYLRGLPEYLDHVVGRLYSLSINSWNIPLWIGEFGGVAVDIKDPQSLKGLNATLSLFDKYKLGWAYWSLEKTGSGAKLVDAHGQTSRGLTEMITNAANTSLLNATSLVEASSESQIEREPRAMGLVQERPGIPPMLPPNTPDSTFSFVLWQASLVLLGLVASFSLVHSTKKRSARQLSRTNRTQYACCEHR